MSRYKKLFSILLAVIGCFAVVTQFQLMFSQRMVSPLEMIVRFFSYFTILTNILLAVYFALQALGVKYFKVGTLTALTVYISVVGIIYQFMLRGLMSFTGVFRIADELLHFVIPLMTLLYWFIYEDKQHISYKQVPSWLLFPSGYFVYILIRGSFSGYYPYPFVDVSVLGYTMVLLNAFFILLFFVFLLVSFVFIGKNANEKVLTTRNPLVKNEK